ncbi:MAG: DUF420 domain-containing protein [Planctomycetota bacterium]
MSYPGWDGFLGTRASFMTDVVFLAMFAVLPVLWWSVLQARRGRYVLHRNVQVALGAVLAVAVGAFEVDVRVFGWEDRASGEIGGSASQAVWRALQVHLVFAISTVVLWPLVLIRALRKFPNPPMPAEHSRFHLRWARIAAADMVLTAVTGWCFYWLAFVS